MPGEIPLVEDSHVINPGFNLPSDTSLPTADKNGLLEDICFVDRTNYIPYILKERAVLFLRPRRFGKTTWINILRRFFENPRSFSRAFCVSRLRIEITPDLWWDPNEKGGFEGCTVLAFDFSIFDRTSADALELELRHHCRDMAEQHGVEVLADDTWSSLLSRIIFQFSRNLTERSVVVLVDEYDSCLAWSHLDPESKEFRAIEDVHSLFYSLLKSLCEGILLRFVTGVSRWGCAGLGPNDIHELSLDPNLSQLLGFTLSEVKSIAKAHSHARPDLMNVFLERCNVYCFDATDLSCKVFNPFFVACEVDKIIPNSRAQHWAATAPPMTVKYHRLMANLKLPVLLSVNEIMHGDMVVHGDMIVLGDRMMSAEALNARRAAAFLFHTGYLTLKEPPASGDRRARYTLGFPGDSICEYLTKEFLERVMHELRDGKVLVGENDMSECLDVRPQGCLDGRPADLHRFFVLLGSILMPMPFIFFDAQNGLAATLENNLRIYFRARRERADEVNADELDADTGELDADTGEGDAGTGERDVDSGEATHFGRFDLELESKASKLIIQIKMTESRDPSDHRRLAEQALKQAKLKRYVSSDAPGKDESSAPPEESGLSKESGLSEKFVISEKRVFYAGASVINGKSVLQAIVLESGACFTLDPGVALSVSEERLVTSCVRLKKQPSNDEFYMSSLIEYLAYHEKEQNKALQSQPKDASDVNTITSASEVNTFTRLLELARKVIDEKQRVTGGINALSLMAVTDEEISVVFGTSAPDIPIMRSAIDFSKPTFASLIENRPFGELGTPNEDDALDLVMDIVSTFVHDLAQRNAVLAGLGIVVKRTSVPPKGLYGSPAANSAKLGVELAIRGARQVLSDARAQVYKSHPSARHEATEPEAKKSRNSIR